MTRTGILQLAIVCAIATSALAAAGAGAETPEIGRCTRTTAHHGEKYKTDRCNTAAKPNGTKNYKWEWVPGVVKPNFTELGGATTLETVSPGLVKIACTKESATGALSGTREVKGVVMTFTHCSSGSTGCGNSKQEIVTNPLEGVFGYKVRLKVVLLHLLLDLFPVGHAGAFAEFACGSTKYVVTGSLVGPIPADRDKRIHSMEYDATAGEQSAETFEGVANTVLQVSREGSAAERAGLNLDTHITGEEGFEINTFV